MKLAWKLFCLAYLIVMLTVGVGGFLLVKVTSDSVVNSKTSAVLTSNEYAGQAFLALAEQSSSVVLRTEEIQNQLAKVVDADKTNQLTVFSQEEAADQEKAAWISELSASQQGYGFIDIKGTLYFQAVCRVDISEKPYYVQTLSDLSDVLAQRNHLVSLYQYTVLIVALLSGVVLLCFSLYMAHPLKRLSQAANQIAAGDYQKRVPMTKRGMGSEEIRTLSGDFNRMAAAVEENVNELEQEIEKQEIFVSNFTHELKTPMTSIIGYADLLRSYELEESEQREAADAIYQEGKRLERLSMQLLDIMVLQNDTVALSPVRTELLFERLQYTLRFLRTKYRVDIEMQTEPATVLAEPTLLLSLLYNLADNACKASSAGAAVAVLGKNAGDRYTVSVVDHGCGIAPEHLDRIMEPFYMEDKSRSRKQGGAGLGLALCKRIAQLHHTALHVESERGRGTTVVFSLEIADPAGSGQEGAKVE